MTASAGTGRRGRAGWFLNMVESTGEEVAGLARQADQVGGWEREEVDMVRVGERERRRSIWRGGRGREAVAAFGCFWGAKLQVAADMEFAGGHSLGMKKVVGGGRE